MQKNWLLIHKSYEIFWLKFIDVLFLTVKWIYKNTKDNKEFWGDYQEKKFTFKI